jgi:hypothetical protein
LAAAPVPRVRWPTLPLVLESNRGDADAKTGNQLISKGREVAMKNSVKNIQRYRAMGSLCRQRAVFDPQNSWKHLGDAERWEHLAHAEIVSHSRERHADGPSGKSGVASNPGNTRWKTIVAA